MVRAKYRLGLVRNNWKSTSLSNGPLVNVVFEVSETDRQRLAMNALNSMKGRCTHSMNEWRDVLQKDNGKLLVQL